MKTAIKLLLIALLFTYNTVAQNIGINTTGATPHSSAVLDLNATDKGFLITRANPASISSPAFGLMTFAPSDSCLYIYSGTTWVCFGGAGSNCELPPPPLPTCSDNNTTVVEVTSTTGKIWMDRNLGANRKATSKDDTQAYGDLYQWGRCTDGHEKRTSGITLTLSTNDIPGHSKFISSTSDWLTPQNHNLWQGAVGVNNPCPTGYRLPTYTEFNAERLSWGAFNQNAAGAYNSALKLPVAGGRESDGTLESGANTRGNYWTSTTMNAFEAAYLHFQTYSAVDAYGKRARGFSIRCIKD